MIISKFNSLIFFIVLSLYFKFIPLLDKIKDVHARIQASGRDIDLEVDGGVNEDTAKQVIAAGANVLVAGTATFKGGPDHYASNIKKLRG